MRLYAVVEGQTEERLVKQVLGPHLDALGVVITPIVVTTGHEKATGRPHRGGGGRWALWKRHIEILCREHHQHDVRFTTWLDLYAFPKGLVDLVELESKTASPSRPAALESAMAQDIPDWRFIPYVQRHELEALVLASLDGLRAALDPSQLAGLEALNAEIGDFAPEDVDGGRETAPSKRLEAHIAGYQKRVHALAAIQHVGLDAVRRVCPGFDAWVKKLERLAVTDD